MDEASLEDEKKPFDAEGPNEEETMPDPDEQLMLHQGNGRVWLVKVRPIHTSFIMAESDSNTQVPKHLMERWSAIDADNVHLATIRVYNEAKNAAGKSPRIMLFLPPNPTDLSAVSDPSKPQFDSGAAFNHNPDEVEPDVYELDMVNDNVENQIFVAERPKAPDPNNTEPINPRARTTVHTGRVRHNCNLRPVLNAAYMKQMRERTRKYNTPQRQIGRIEDAGISGGRGGINKLTSGVGVGSGTAFNSLVVRILTALSSVRKLTTYYYCRVRNQNQRKALSSVWPACPKTNCSTSSSYISEKNHVGLSNFFARELNSPNHI